MLVGSVSRGTSSSASLAGISAVILEMVAARRELTLCISLVSFGGGQLCCICKRYSVVSALQSLVSVANFFLLLMSHCNCKEGENMALFFHLPALNFNHISHFMFPTAAALWLKQGTKDVVKPSSPKTFMMSTSCTRFMQRTYACDVMFFRKPSVLHWSLSSALWPYLLWWGRRLPNLSSMIFCFFKVFYVERKNKEAEKKSVRTICLV